MQEIWEKLMLLERELKPQTRWLLQGLAAVMALNYAVEFGEKVGRALYYLTH